MNQTDFDVIIVGGGAAGYFTAINIGLKKPNARILILEKNREGLQKVKVSGGGRCNVTNQEEKPTILTQFYPRGHDILAQCFERFGSKETKAWFEAQGLVLKTEADGRVFPKANTSEAVISLFKKLIEKYKIEVRNSSKMLNFEPKEKGFEIYLDERITLTSGSLVLASGSDKHVYELLKEKDLEIAEPLPSLFTFNIEDPALRDLSGTSFKNTTAEIIHAKLSQSGPALITHWGLSGPSILKLSAWGARLLAESDYRFKLKINLAPNLDSNQKIEELRSMSLKEPKKNVINTPCFNLSQKFWKYLCQQSQISEFQKWAETGKKQWQRLASALHEAQYEVVGKSTFKEEFVTAGGVEINEINLNTFESKKIPQLYFCGEILNIDGVTGGFNFQAAWTGAWHVAEAIKNNI
jgi:predicted Rossmann fold flavoprotein